MPKGIYNHKSKREQILQAASKVYAHLGFEGATIEKMAEAAGVSKSLITAHFGSKQGLVRAIVDWKITCCLAQIRAFDQIPDLTLLQRELLIHKLIKEDRELWCLILGTVLVPNFEFQQRSSLPQYLEGKYNIVLSHLDELRQPTAQFALAYTYSTISLHMSFVIVGQEDVFDQALAQHMELYLKQPEE